MRNTEILFKPDDIGIIEKDLMEFKENENCLICGKDIKEGVLSKKVLSGNFTNWSNCNSLDSNYICKECAYCLKNADYRKNNIVADKENIYLLKKNDLEEYLFNLDKYVKDEFIVCITQSFKKHNSFRAKVNNDTKCFYIREEDREYLFNAKEIKEVYKKLNEAYLQFSKEEMLTGDYKLISLEQFGIEKFEEYENVFKKYRGSAQFDLLIYILNSERRNEYIKEKMKREKEEKARLKALEKENKKAKNNKQISFL